MSPALLGMLLPYLAHVPDAIQTTITVVNRVKDMLAAGPVTEEMLIALAAELRSGHDALPLPKD